MKTFLRIVGSVYLLLLFVVFGCRSVPETGVEAGRYILKSSAKAYQKPKAVMLTRRYEVFLPGSRTMKREIEYGFGSGTDLYFKIGDITQVVALGNRIFYTQVNVPDKYVEGQYDGDFTKALKSIGAENAGLPNAPGPVQMRLGRDVDEIVQGFGGEVFETLQIGDYRKIEKQDGSVLHEIRLDGSNGWIKVRIDDATRFLSEIDMEIRMSEDPAGDKISSQGMYETRILESTEALVTFDPTGRTAVATLHALESGNLEIGAEAPDFTLSSIQGKIVRLSDLRGKIVILDFWATFCMTCPEILRDLEVFADWVASSNVDVVIHPVSTFIPGSDDREKHQAVANWWQSKGFSMDTLLDMDSKVVKAFGQAGVPSLFVIAPDGKIAERHSGSFPEMVEQLKVMVSRLGDKSL